MKTLILNWKTTLFVGLTGLTVACSGCASTKQFTPVQWGTIAETVSYSGTVIYLEKHPDKVPAFRAAKASLDLCLSNGKTSAADLHQALSGLGVNALSGNTGLVIVDSAVVLVTTLQGGQAPLEQAPVANAVMNGIAHGIGDALQVVKP